MESATEDSLTQPISVQQAPVEVVLEAHSEDHCQHINSCEDDVLITSNHDMSSSRAGGGVVLQPIDINDIIDRVMKLDDEVNVDDHIAGSSSNSIGIDVFKESLDVINLLNHTPSTAVDILATNSTDFIQPLPTPATSDRSDYYDADAQLSPPYDKSLFEADSIESEVGVESDGSQRKILDLILTLQQRLLAQDDAAADEWENDEDTGYMVVALAEDDFFELEEEVSIRMLDKEVPKDRGSATDTVPVASDSPIDTTSAANLIDDRTVGGGTVASVDPSVTAQTPSHSVNALTGDGIIAGTQEVKTSSQPAVQSTSSMVWDTIAGSISTVIAAVTSNPIPPSSVPPGPLPPPIPPTHLQDDRDDHSRNRDVGNEEASKKMSLGEQRRTEVMGQRKFMGADGLHSYFNLKVIFEPFRTGFEESKDLQHPKGTIIAGRYEVFDLLGQAAFSTALQCTDLAAEEDEAQWVCLKVIKNNKDFFDQSLDEIKLLQYINSCGDPDQHHVLRLIDFFYCKEHLFIVSELLKENLYEFGRFIRDSHGEPYYTIPRLKRITKQVLEALVFVHSLNLIHCDIKPENIVIKSFSRCEVKLIDFGSSCFTSDHLTTYIQSRSYRAPEVIIGYDYDARIDIWSVGAVLAELFTGYVLFQNDSVPTMLARITGILGPFPAHVLEASRETGKYFSLSNIVYERDEDGSFNLIFPKKTNLSSRLHLPTHDPCMGSREDALFLDFVRQMLHLDPARRLTAAEALAHPWLADADTIYVKEYIIGQTNNNAPQHPVTRSAATSFMVNGNVEADEYDDAQYEEDVIAAAQEEEAALEYAYFMSQQRPPQDEASTVDAYLQYLQKKRQNFFEDEDDDDDDYSDGAPDLDDNDDDGIDDDDDYSDASDRDEGVCNLLVDGDHLSGEREPDDRRDE